VERFEKREDLQKVSPGQFKESASANRIFFVEGVAGKTAVVQNVFVNTVDEKGTAVIVAREGVINTGPKGERYLVLKNGRRYQGVPGQADFQTMEFESYSMRVASKSRSWTANAIPTPCRPCSCWRHQQRRPRRTAVAHRLAADLPGADPAGDPAGLRQSARRQFGQPDYRAADLLQL
jgi:hypothetical protein